MRDDMSRPALPVAWTKRVFGPIVPSIDSADGVAPFAEMFRQIQGSGSVTVRKDYSVRGDASTSPVDLEPSGPQGLLRSRRCFDKSS